MNKNPSIQWVRTKAEAKPGRRIVPAMVIKKVKDNAVYTRTRGCAVSVSISKKTLAERGIYPGDRINLGVGPGRVYIAQSDPDDECAGYKVQQKGSVMVRIVLSGKRARAMLPYTGRYYDVTDDGNGVFYVETADAIAADSHDPKG